LPKRAQAIMRKKSLIRVPASVLLQAGSKDGKGKTSKWRPESHAKSERFREKADVVTEE